MQPDLEAALTWQHAVVALRRGHWDEAFQQVERELAGYRARGLQTGQLRAVIMRNGMRPAKSEPGDLVAIARDVQTWRPLALATHQTERARQLDVLAAMARFQLGDVTTSHAELIRLWRAQPPVKRSGESRRITGEVVDARDRPVAGATVAAESMLSADSAGIGLPALMTYEHFRDDNLRIVTSDASGQFVIEDAVPDGVIAAQLADRRSEPLAMPIT